MALTDYETTTQRTAVINSAIAALNSARKSVTDAAALSAELTNKGFEQADIADSCNDVLTVAKDNVSGAIAMLGYIDVNFPYQVKAVIGCPGAYSSCAIDSGTKTFTASGGLPFSEFAAGDVLLVTNAEDAANMKTLTVSSIGGGGSSMVVVESVTTNASDTKLAILHLKKFS